MKVVVASHSNEKKGRLPDSKTVKKRCLPKRRLQPLKARTFFYYALGDGVRKAFTLEDAIPGYDSQIPDPCRVSLTNVFVDGMLQSPELYVVHPGILLFISDQPPPADSRVIAQFVVIKADRPLR